MSDALEPEWPEPSRALIDRSRVARLATVDAKGRPHVVPICFVLVGDCLYTIVDDKPKRRDRPIRRLVNIEAEPNVAIVIDAYDDDWDNLEYVQLRGRASLVSDGGVFLSVRAELRKKYEGYRSMNLRASAHPLIEVRVAHVHYWHA